MSCPMNKGRIHVRQRNADWTLADHVADNLQTTIIRETKVPFEWRTDSAAEATRSLMNWIEASQILIIETLRKLS
jgi:hypothetical protein